MKTLDAIRARRDLAAGGAAVRHGKIVIDGAAVHAKAHVGVTCVPVSGGSGAPRR